VISSIATNRVVLWSVAASTLLCCALLPACGGGDSSGPSSTLNVSLADAPSSLAGVQSVFITVTGVEVQPTNGSPLTLNLSSPLTIDLLTLQRGNVAALVNGAAVPAGTYAWLRLILDTSAGKDYVLYCSSGAPCAAPTQIALNIPSGAETGLKIVRGFAMPVNGAIHLVVDFNVNSSIVPLPNSTSWHLKPVLRVVETDTVGAIAGTISAAAMQAAKVAKTACSSTNLPTVYVYSAGSATTNVMPDDIFTGTEEPIETNPVQPIVTQLTTYNAANGSASFNIQWLASDSGYNEYTIAFSCDPDDPGVDESAIVPPATTATISFNTYPTPVAVTTDATTTVDF
jgi:uncharacterized protein DUF4382